MNKSLLNFKHIGYRLVGIESDPSSIIFIFEYNTTHYTLSEFSAYLSKFLGLVEYTFRPIEIVGSDKKFYEITFER